jgi:hypothetical protein
MNVTSKGRPTPSCVALIVLAQGTSAFICFIHTGQLSGGLPTIEGVRGKSRNRHRGSGPGVLLPWVAPLLSCQARPPHGTPLVVDTSVLVKNIRDTAPTTTMTVVTSTHTSSISSPDNWFCRPHTTCLLMVYRQGNPMTPQNTQGHSEKDRHCRGTDPEPCMCRLGMLPPRISLAVLVPPLGRNIWTIRLLTLFDVRVNC